MKVFGIGWHKTGTTSLGKYLASLGYLVCNDAYTVPPSLPVYNEYLQNVLRGYDAFVDMPFPLITEMLIRRYPDAKFIHTVREPDAWWNSAYRHFSGTTHPIRERAYPGCPDPEGSEEAWRMRYRLHKQQVNALASYVDVLKLPLDAEDKAALVSNFLDKPIHPEGYPHANQESTQAGRCIST